MVRKLPVVRFRGKRWFFDARLSELRNVKNPHEWIDLDEYMVAWLKPTLEAVSQ